MCAIRYSGFAFLSLSLLLIPQVSVHAEDIDDYGLSPLEQTAMSDTIVLGRVVGIDPEPVLVPKSNDGSKTAYMVVSIRIDESLFGAKGLTHVRVGFVPQVRKLFGANGAKIFT